MKTRLIRKESGRVLSLFLVLYTVFTVLLFSLFSLFLTSVLSSALNFDGFFRKVFWAFALIFTLIFLPETGSISVFFVTFGLYTRRVARRE